MRDGQGIHVTYVPGTYRPLANKDNDYLMDRAAQKAGRPTAASTASRMQDASLQESMGPIVDRTKENLVSTDNGIIMARHRLLRALKAMEKGETPPGIDPAHQRVRSAAVVLPPDQPSRTPPRKRWSCRPGKEHVDGVDDAEPNPPAWSSAAEARFRIDAPNSKPRAVKVIALDQPSERVVKDLAQRSWNSATLLHRLGLRRRAAQGRELLPAGSAISPAAPRT